MAVEVPTRSFRDGHLPGVCICTGTPATGWQKTTAKSRIGAQWVLAFFGVLPLVIVRALTIKRAVGYLPVNPDEIRKRTPAVQRAKYLYVSLAGIATFAIPMLILVILGFTVEGLVAAVVAFIALLIFLDSWSANMAARSAQLFTKFGIHLDRSGDQTIIASVHPDFMRAAAAASQPPLPSVSPSPLPMAPTNASSVAPVASDLPAPFAPASAHSFTVPREPTLSAPPIPPTPPTPPSPPPR